MGVYYHTYLGPFFHCVCPIGERSEQHKACSNVTCKNHRPNAYISAKFCPECGSPVEKQTFSVRGPTVNSHSLYEPLEEKLSLANGNYGPYDKTPTSETHLWIPNIYPDKPKLPPGYKPRRLSGEAGNVGYTVLDPEVISAEIRYLYMNFEDSQKILQEHYGDNNVNIRWGLIQYAS